MNVVAVDDPVLEAASALAVPGLRSLDAIHVATAMLCQDDLRWLVTYDRRMAAVAEGMGMSVCTPSGP